MNKIWDAAPHNAFTDLVFFQNRWICSFREAHDHIGDENGVLRLIESKDAISWHSLSLLRLPGVDLRDPKICVCPDGRLMLLAGGAIYKKGNYHSFRSYVAFSDNGIQWSELNPILNEHDWLWRVTWHQGSAYGIAYRGNKKEIVTLFESNNGSHYQKIIDLTIPGYPSEATVQFAKTGEMVTIIRRDQPGKRHAWIGLSSAPYKKWRWFPQDFYFAAPHFLFVEDDLVAAGRIVMRSPYGIYPNTAVAACKWNGNEPHLNFMLTLPSGGDTSYPGMVFHQERLWVSYYSSHEGKASIYFACLQYA